MAADQVGEVSLPTDTEILITRMFDVPKQLIYRAWTTPELVRRWWGGERDAHRFYMARLDEALDRLEQTALSESPSRQPSSVVIAEAEGTLGKL